MSEWGRFLDAHIDAGGQFITRECDSCGFPTTEQSCERVESVVDITHTAQHEAQLDVRVSYVCPECAGVLRAAGGVC